MDDRTSGPAAVAAVGDATVDDEAGLRGLYKQPMGLAVLKQLDRLDAHCRNFLAHSPFAVIGSTRPGRGTDVSPRGDAPGFARVLDDHTIAIPDRPGNNRLDTLSNIVTDAEVGLLFFIPGIDETLRINGTAKLSRDPELLAAAAVQGREPRLVILVTVREAFLHCGKALEALASVARRLSRRQEVVPFARANDRRADQAEGRDRRTGGNLHRRELRDRPLLGVRGRSKSFVRRRCREMVAAVARCGHFWQCPRRFVPDARLHSRAALSFRAGLTSGPHQPGFFHDDFVAHHSLRRTGSGLRHMGHVLGDAGRSRQPTHAGDSCGGARGRAGLSAAPVRDDRRRRHRDLRHRRLFPRLAGGHWLCHWRHSVGRGRVYRHERFGARQCAYRAGSDRLAGRRPRTRVPRRSDHRAPRRRARSPRGDPLFRHPHRTAWVSPRTTAPSSIPWWRSASAPR